MVIATVCGFALVGLIDELLLLLSGTIDETLLALGSGFHALDHSVRRKALSILVDETVVHRTELAERLVRDGDVPYEDADQLSVALHHHHLPKLADHDYVEYDPRSGDVVLWREPSTVRALLDSRVFS